MPYKPLNISPAGRQSGSATSLMSPKGINLRDLPQLLDSSYCQNCENWLIDAAGQLIKRGGSTKIFEAAGTTPITLLKEFTDDIWIFAYDDKLAAYTISTDTVSAIHTFTAAGAATGDTVGDYFFVCNGSERIAYVTTALAYSLVTDTNAPQATVLYAALGRLFAGADSTLYWSDIDEGDDPPFNKKRSWTVGADAYAGATAYEVDDKVTYNNGVYVCIANSTGNLPTDTAYWSPSTLYGMAEANKAEYRNAGTIKAITTLGQQVVGLYEKGKVGFRIVSQQLTISGGVNATIQDTVTDFQRIDFGAVRGAIYTQKGVFYANEQGVYQLLSGGSTNQPYSEQDNNISIIFGKDFFEDVDFSNADLIHDTKNNLILCTCAQDSDTNNLILWYNIDTKAWGKITGWNISRFMRIDGVIYGASATGIKVWKLFSGYSDEGTQIRAEYSQELNLKDLTNIKSLEDFFIHGQLSPSSEVSIYFDIYDKRGQYSAAKKTLLWTTSTKGTSTGVGSEPFAGAWGDSGTESGLTPSLLQTKNARINEFLRVKLRIIVSDALPCRINWLSLFYKVKYPARLNNSSLDLGGDTSGIDLTFLDDESFYFLDGTPIEFLELV